MRVGRTARVAVGEPAQCALTRVFPLPSARLSLHLPRAISRGTRLTSLCVAVVWAAAVGIAADGEGGSQLGRV